MFLAKLIVPLGIFTWLLVLLAVLTGLRIVKAKLAAHRVLALVAIASATIHGLIVIYMNSQ